ncbi:MAG: hypothetical protein JW730_03385 [Anaerolineales bacterium]|nr:hypothetical protein [Anaerolineales bacterium]
MNSTMVLENTPRGQDRLGRGLMWLAALGALAAFVSALAGISSAAPETLWVETWRLFGFLVFTGMFVLLALRPRKSAGVWELAFFHKAAMGVSAIFLANAEGAALAATIDAVLAVVILAAYILTRGWMSWKN